MPSFSGALCFVQLGGTLSLPFGLYVLLLQVSVRETFAFLHLHISASQAQRHLVGTAHWRPFFKLESLGTPGGSLELCFFLPAAVRANPG